MRAIFILMLFAITANASEQMSANRSTLPTDFDVSYDLIPTAGLSVFSATGSGIASVSDTEGFVGGLLVDFHTPLNALKYETGALFMQEGDSVANSGFTRTNNYLLIPMLAKVEVARVRYLAFDLRGGLAPAFLISANTQHASTVVTDATPETRSFDLQALVGIGTAYSITPQLKLIADLAYTRGLLSFLINSNPIYNEGFMLTGGLQF